jgi:hypothetical protein
MARGISLHIGINQVDPNHYDGWIGKLNACENDAKDMQAIAHSYGYESGLLLSKDATSNEVIKSIDIASQKLEDGDIFLLTYSGHGSRIKDTSGDEEDRNDETWVLYDRMLIDDELYTMWSKFKTGTRIVIISDSCHSGTVAKEISENEHYLRKIYPDFYNTPERFNFKTVPPDISFTTHNKHLQLYDSIQEICSKGENYAVNASIILLAACQDNQTASDGSKNSLYTAILKQVWDEGRYNGNYIDFWKKMVDKSPSTQSPSYYKTGCINLDFENCSPFEV